jgi:nicotinamide-nucleotide amidase
VRIHKHTWQGERQISYDSTVTTRDRDQVVVKAYWQFPTPTRDLGYVTLINGDLFIETFYLDRWYNVFEIRSPEGVLKGWYANVTRPAYELDGALIWEDLFLDVWMSPHGEVLYLDEDEFVEAAPHLTPLDRVSAQGAVRQATENLRQRWRAYANDRIAAAMTGRGWRLGTAESCTGGLLGAVLTDHPGASAYVQGGVIAYDNTVKQDGLGVPVELLITHGAVSEPVARAMADGVRLRLGVDVGISVTGIAGPNGATPDKPVGLVYLGLSTPGGTQVERHVWPHDRVGNKQASADAALRLLMRTLDV